MGEVQPLVKANIQPRSSRPDVKITARLRAGDGLAGCCVTLQGKATSDVPEAVQQGEALLLRLRPGPLAGADPGRTGGQKLSRFSINE